MPLGLSLSIQPIHKYPMRKSKASEALCVAQQVAAIRAALHKQGYQIRKRPRQAAWNVLTPLHPPNSLARGTGRAKEATAKTHQRKSYLLTYQPAPISTWVLHPQTNDPDYHSLETIIQQAISRSAS
ncbi:MAG: hypothetical protein Fur006_31280 [Coleofasciculaceae cyanobacterium]